MYKICKADKANDNDTEIISTLEEKISAVIDVPKLNMS